MDRIRSLERRLLELEETESVLQASQADLQWAHRLLNSANRALTGFIHSEDPQTIFAGLLQDLLELTGSEAGFIGEILVDSGGEPFLRTHAVVGTDRGQVTQPNQESWDSGAVEFRDLQTLVGRVITLGEPLICNDLPASTRPGGLLGDSPCVKSFLGLPFSVARKTIGMVGIANRADGYDEAFVERLRPVLSTCGTIVEGLRSVSVQRAAQREVAEKDLLTRSVIDAAVDGIVIIDDRGVIQSFNPSAERIFGYTAGETIGQNIRMLMPEPEASQHDRHLHRYLQTDQGRIIGTGREVQGRRKDGSVFPMELAVSELRVGQRRSFVGMIHDITRLKEAEQALRSERDRAESANRFKSQFLANMSHEIRTPMNGILGMSTLLSETRLDVEQREFVETIRSSAESLLAIINDILDFSKVEAGKLELQSRPFDLRATMSEIHKLFALRIRKRELQFSGKLAPDVPTRLMGDPVRLRQVLVNLLGNATKFTEAGSITYSVSVQQAADRWVALRFDVVDTGLGIPPEHQQSVFEVFTQVRRDDGQNFDGTGLGLAISAKLVQMMGGRIWFESVPGKGTTFSFTAVFQTLSSQGQQVSTSPRSAGQTAPRPLKILLAEDNSVNRQLAERFLRGAGHQVVSVRNGDEAVRQVFSDRFDVVLMDVQMPVLDGFAATRAIRERERDTGRRIPIVAMTAYAMLGDRQRCLDTGMDDYVSKPIKMKALLECLARFAQEPTSDDAVAVSSDEEQAVYDEDSLLQRLDGNTQLLSELVHAFLEDVPKLLQELRQAVSRHQTPRIAAIAHTIKGIVSNFETGPCREAAAELEQACEEGGLERMQQLSSDLERAVNDLSETLRTISLPTP